MNNSKKSIKKITVLIVLMFLLIMGATAKITLVDGDKMIANAYNPRINAADSTIKRGDIKDIDGFV